MFTSYADSVMAHTDAEGKLNAFDVQQLLKEHGFTTTDWVKDHAARNISDELLDHAETILHWLGY